MYSISNSTNKKKTTLTIFLILSFIIPSVILIIAYAMNKIWLGSDKTVLISDLRALNFPLSASLRHVLSGDASIFYQTYSLLGSGNISTYMSSYSGLFSWFMGNESLGLEFYLGNPTSPPGAGARVGRGGGGAGKGQFSPIP